MDAIMNTNTEVTDEAQVETTPETTETSTTQTETAFSKEDFEKRLQSETDKIRTKYSKQIKSLEDKIAELSPVDLSPVEKQLQERLAELESKQSELDTQKAFMDLQESLTNAGLSKDMATYLKGDIDLGEFSKLVDALIIDRTKASAYQPQQHQSNDGLTQEQWRKMSYSERAELYEKNPTLYQKFITK